MAALRLFSEFHSGCRSIPQRCSLLGGGCHVLRIASSPALTVTNGSGRRLKSSASPAALDRAVSTELPPQRDPLDLSFNDARAAYKSKSTGELLRAYIVLKLSSSNWIVNNHQEVSAVRHSFMHRRTVLFGKTDARRQTSDSGLVAVPRELENAERQN
ncbi:hypothetical protein HPB49_024192 [Dermacentor silvarum]|uniref:Uncharacterized protein n=1 Tax=Dermacentor silvarum TaxID=543639 RepID=A0ACB8D8Z4_DERSI|nr:hypothetical protein HPB49_024192 [Dermacentor silvarum]